MTAAELGRSRGVGLLVLGAAGAGAGAVVLWPLVRAAVRAAEVMGSASVPGLGRTIIISAGLAAAATAIGTVLALAAALVARTLPRVPRRVLDVMIAGILAVPPFAVAGAVLAAGGRSGWLAHVLPDVYGVPGLLAAMVLAHLPIPYVTARVAWRAIDPRLIEAARVNGARMRDIVRLVLLPPVSAPLSVAMALMAVTALSDPSIPAVLRGRVPTLAHTAYTEVVAWGDDGIAALIACLLALPLVPLLLVKARERAEPHLMGGWLSGKASPRLALPSSGLLLVARLLTAALVGAILLLAGTALITTLSAGPVLGPGTMRIVATTARLSLIALVLAVPAGLATAWAAGAGPARLGRVIDGAQVALLLLPGTTLGIAFFLAYRLGTPTPVGTVPPLVGGASAWAGSAAIIAVFTATTVPMVHLAARAARGQLSALERESARVLGMSPRRITTRLVLPQVGTAVVAMAGVAVARNLVSVAPVVFVATPDAPMVPAHALDLLDRMELAQVFALTAVVALPTAALMTLIAAAITRGAAGRGAAA